MEQKSIVKLTNLLNFTRQDFDVLEQKLIILILEELRQRQGFNIDIIPNTSLELSFNYSDFLQDNSSLRLKAMAERIISRHIYFESSENNWDYVVPFIRASYRNGVFRIKINEDVVKYFLDLAKGYTNLNKSFIFALSSSHAIRMYELLSAFIKDGKWTVLLNDFREYIGIQNKYNNYNSFESKILKYCQKELAEHCNLYFSWEVATKQRKKITALTFYIKTKEQQEKAEINEEIKYTIDFVKQLNPAEIAQRFHWASSKYTLTSNQLDYILSNPDMFNEFIRIDLIIESMIEKGKAPKDRTKYLAKSLGLDKVKI